MSEADKPLVSVVMPVYNGERFLAEAIESILAQTLADFELLIVDDGSSDGSAAIARDYAKGDERIRLIQHERNKGLASAMNSGIFAARGAFIAQMDCDDISRPRRLEKQLDFLLSHSDIGVVGACVQSVKADMTAPFCHQYPLQHALIALRFSLGMKAVAGPTIMTRRETLIAVGGFEESQTVAEDAEVFSRLLCTTRFANLPEALYIYRRHDHQVSVRQREAQRSAGLESRQRLLNRLVGDEQPIAIDGLKPLRAGVTLGWRERRRLRRDLARLINAMVAANMLAAGDLPLIEAEVNRRLESTMPRRWQMLLHWRRRRFGPG